MHFERTVAMGALTACLMVADVFAGVEDVRALYKQINSLVESKVARLVSTYATGQGERLQWRTVATRADQGQFEKSDYRAQVYLDQDRVIKAQLKTNSQSGDWTFTEDYYFYKNGRTAFYFRSLLTFQGYDVEHDKELPPGPYIVEVRHYYDESGKEIRRLEKAFIQATKKELPVKYVRADLPIEIYADVTLLPFYAVIPGVKR
jgi:hypothetical protein